MSKTFLIGPSLTTRWPKGITNPMGLAYKDVSIAPRISSIKHRGDVDISVHFGKIKLQVPVIAAPMEFSTEKVIREMHRLGALGTLPRPKPGESEAYLKLAEKLIKDGVQCLYAIGIDDGLDFARALEKKGATSLLIDVAHGGQKRALDLATQIIKHTKLDVALGNIATGEQAKEYLRRGITIARVGVGSGSPCETRVVAGVGIGQLSTVMATTRTGLHIIADGSIKEYGHVVKAIAAGAHTAMLGSMLARTVEGSGHKLGEDAQYRGQASKSYMEDRGKKVGPLRSSEGKEILLKVDRTIEDVIHGISGGLRSGMSYVGAKTIKEFQEKAQFVQLGLAAQDDGPARSW